MTRLFVVMTIWLAVVAAAAPTVESVELRSTATVPGAAVRLSDIAVVQPPEAAAELGAVEIGPGPLPGASREFAAGYVRLRLRKAGVNLKGVAFSGAERVTVSREAPPPAPVAPTTAGGRTDQELRRPSAAAAQDGSGAGRNGAPPAGAATPAPAEQLRRGTICRLVVRNGGLSIEALGELMAPCAVGQIGKFRVSETRAIVAAVLTSASTAEVTR